MTLNHVHLGSADLSKSIEFYKLYFGFEKKFDHGNGAFLYDKKGFLLAIDPVQELPVFPDWYHLGFCLDNEEQVHLLYKRMIETGVAIVRDLLSEKGEFASFYVKDPDGNKLEISWHNE